VVTTDFAPGEHERPGRRSHRPDLRSRDARGGGFVIGLEQAGLMADWIASTGRNLTTILMQLTGTAITSSGRAFFWNASQKRNFVRAQRDSSHEGANLTGVCGEVLESGFRISSRKASCGCQELQAKRYRPGRR